MKRDMDLFREIALYIERQNGQRTDTDQIHVNGFDRDQIAYHTELMVEAKLLSAIDITTLSDHFKQYSITRLTNAGHDFLDNARSDTVWQSTKKKLGEVGGTVSIGVLMAYLKMTIGEKLGINIE